MSLIDITRTLGKDTLNWPGDPPFRIEEASSTAAGDAWNLSHLELSDHSGTHLDSPAHFIPGAPTADQIPIERFFGIVAHVIEIAEEVRCVEPRHFPSLRIASGEAVLFKTGNSNLSRKDFVEDYTYLSVDAAQWMVANHAGLVGVDYLSPDAPESEEFPVHQRLLNNEILLLEDLDLRYASAGTYILYCLPLKIARASGGPCRAILEKAAAGASRHR